MPRLGDIVRIDEKDPLARAELRRRKNRARQASQSLEVRWERLRQRRLYDWLMRQRPRRP